MYQNRYIIKFLGQGLHCNLAFPRVAVPQRVYQYQQLIQTRIGERSLRYVLVQRSVAVCKLYRRFEQFQSTRPVWGATASFYLAHTKVVICAVAPMSQQFMEVTAHCRCFRGELSRAASVAVCEL